LQGYEKEPMAIAQAELLRARQQRPLLKSMVFAGVHKTAVLCHSHRDEQLAAGLQALLAEQGVMLHIDWKDASMPSKPNRETAARIQRRIKMCDWFLFLATANSMSARHFDVFLDTHSVSVAADFQAALWHRLCDSDVLVMLDTPDYFASRWTTAEWGRA